MNIKPDISIVVPVYNGASTISLLFSRIDVVFQSLNMSYEVIFIDDGSKDNSWQIIQQLNLVHGNKIKGFQLVHNSGQQAATLCGMQQAKGEWIITIDDDLQTPPEEIPKLLEFIVKKKMDVVYGIYAKPKHSFIHKFSTSIFRKILKKVAPNYPNGSSFRLIKANVLNRFPQQYSYWVFVDAMLAWATTDIITVNVNHEKTHNKKSRYSILKLFSIAITLLFVYSTLPLQIIVWIGFFASLISMTLGIYFFIQKITVGAPLGFSALIVTITFTSGIILFCLGILGEYISKIFIMATGRPAFIIKSKTTI